MAGARDVVLRVRVPNEELGRQLFSGTSMAASPVPADLADKLWLLNALFDDTTDGFGSTEWRIPSPRRKSPRSRSARRT